MRKIWVHCLIIMLLLSGCGTKEFNKYEGADKEDNTSSVTESDKTENTISDKSIAEVFENQKQFFDTESQKYMHLKNYSSSKYMVSNNNNKYEYVSDDAAGDKTLEVLQWCQLDMDSDGKEEVLLQMSNGNILVLRNEDNVVYGYAFPFRGMKNVKIDGSFEGSGSAANCYIGRLKFENKECFYEEICVVDELDKDNLMYRINKQDSNKEATVLYMEEQKKKEDAVWTVVETSDYYFKTLFEEKIGAITDKQVYETVVKDFDNSGTKEAFVLTIENKDEDAIESEYELWFVNSDDAKQIGEEFVAAYDSSIKLFNDKYVMLNIAQHRQNDEMKCIIYEVTDNEAVEIYSQKKLNIFEEETELYAYSGSYAVLEPEFVEWMSLSQQKYHFKWNDELKKCEEYKAKEISETEFVKMAQSDTVKEKITEELNESYGEEVKNIEYCYLLREDETLDINVIVTLNEGYKYKYHATVTCKDNSLGTEVELLEGNKEESVVESLNQ